MKYSIKKIPSRIFYRAKSFLNQFMMIHFLQADDIWIIANNFLYHSPSSCPPVKSEWITADEFVIL